MTGFPTDSVQAENSGGKVIAWLLLGLVLLFGAAYVAAYLVAGDKVPQGTTVVGVDIGGRSPAEAAQALESGLAPLQSEPLTVTVGENTRRVTPDEAGLAIDAPATVATTGGERSWSPARLWEYFTGGDDVDPVVTVDEAKMTAALGQITDQTGTAPVEGAVSFRNGSVKVTRAVVGEGIDPAQARAALESAYLSDGRSAMVPLGQVEPEIDHLDVQEALDSFANPAVSGAVTLDFGKHSVRLQPEVFTKALSMKPEDGELVPKLDQQRLARLIKAELKGDGGPVDATVRIVDGEPKVIPDRPGVGFDPADINAAFLQAVTGPPEDRRIKVDATVEQARFQTEDAEALEILEQVSTFTTYYPHADYRNTNIGRAAELVDGTLLKPGETFSLNDIVGERTVANGFTEGYIINDGILVKDLGGGVSQMATTTFNAMFFAGLKDVEHKPHSFYIDRYPVGREATVAWGAVDLRFQNDTPYGVLITAHVTPSTASTSGVVTVSMWSTKYWDITTTTGDRYNFTEPDTRVLTTDDCYPNEGYGGFDIDVVRYFRRHGESELHHKENFHTTYIPSDTVKCRRK